MTAPTVSGDSQAVITVDVVAAVARRFAYGWAWNGTRKSWWKYTARDSMNVRVPYFEKATEAEVSAVRLVLSGSSE